MKILKGLQGLIASVRSKIAQMLKARNSKYGRNPHLTEVTVTKNPYTESLEVSSEYTAPSGEYWEYTTRKDSQIPNTYLQQTNYYLQIPQMKRSAINFPDTVAMTQYHTSGLKRTVTNLTTDTNSKQWYDFRNMLNRFNKSMRSGGILKGLQGLFFITPSLVLLRAKAKYLKKAKLSTNKSNLPSLFTLISDMTPSKIFEKIAKNNADPIKYNKQALQRYSEEVEHDKLLNPNISLLLDEPELISMLEPQLGHAIYLHYPNFIGKSANALKIGSLDIGLAIGNPEIPVGHAATIMIDPNGKATYYDYGRFTNGFGHVRPTVKGGNWRKIELPAMRPNENDSVYMTRVQGMLPDTKTGPYQAMTLLNIDTNSARDWIYLQANDPNRPEYSIFNTCANGACDATIPFLVIPEIRPSNRSNTEGYSSGAKAWSHLPNSTGRNAAIARERAHKVYVMNK